MQIQQLEYLMKVVECGSITRAAQQLFLSQPSLTKSISNLESEYHIKIFDRRPKGIQLTPEGKEFLYYAQNVLNAIRSLDKVFEDGFRSGRHILSIASQQFSFLYDLILQTYRQFESHSIHIDLLEADRGEIVEAVIGRTADNGLIVCSHIDARPFHWLVNDKNLEVHVIDYSNIYVSVGPKSPLYNAESVRPEELVDQLQIVLDMEDDTKSGVYSKKEGHINTHHVFFCNSLASCIHFLLRTDAFAFTQKWVIDSLEKTPIRSIPLESRSQSNELVWVKRTNEATSEVEKQFLHNLYNHFGNSIPPL